MRALNNSKDITPAIAPCLLTNGGCIQVYAYITNLLQYTKSKVHGSAFTLEHFHGFLAEKKFLENFRNFVLFFQIFYYFGSNSEFG